MAVLCHSVSPSLRSMMNETMLLGDPQMMDDPFYLDSSQWSSGGGGGSGVRAPRELPARSYAMLARRSAPQPYNMSVVSSTQLHAIRIAVNNTQISELDADDVSLDSWQKTHPEQWTCEDVLNLIYYIALRSNDIEFASLHGEQFQNVSGAELCSMTEEDFILKDPKYGKMLYNCVRVLLEKSQFLPPEEIVCVKKEMPDLLKSIKSEIPRPVEELSFEESSDMFDYEMKNVVNMFGISYDFDSAADFGNIQPTTDVIVSSSSSSFSSSTPSSSSPSKVGVDTTCINVDQISTADSKYNDNHAYRMSFYPDYHHTHRQQQQQHLRHEHGLVPDSNFSGGGTPFPMDLRRNHETDSAASDFLLSLSDRTKMKRRREKSMSSDGEGSNSNSSQGLHDVNRSSNLGKGNHLWEFLCQLLRNSESVQAKDRIIQWESRDEGIFRIIDSKEVANLWGKHKNNDNMTYEKLSRALRWCRTFGFLAALPKEGKFPKKLCFRFGPRATSWRNFL